MREQEILERTREFVKKQMANNDVGHDYLHVERVVALAKDIAGFEQGSDPFLTEMVALLHDINDHKLCTDEKVLTNFLNTLPLQQDEKEKILVYTGYISYTKYPKPDLSISVEARIVQDADRLDALGAIGVARTFAYSGAKKRPFYGEDSHCALAHFEEKLCHLSEALSTERGKGIARQRQAYLNGFLEQFMAELELNK
jgi:uncharacterized protein